MRRWSRSSWIAAGWTAMFAMTGAAEDVPGPLPLPDNAPALSRDVVVVVAGSSVSVRRYKVHKLPAWTGGPNRVPPQCTNGQNVFFRVFEMLNDHANMRWRRLPDADWTKSGEWKAYGKLPYRDASPRVSWLATDPDAYAELVIPAGYEKVDVLYTSDPNGDELRVTLNGKPPVKGGMIETCQDRSIPPAAERGPTFETLDSHGKLRKIRPPKAGIANIVELRARFRLDPARKNTIRVQRATADPDKRVLVWGAVYWRGYAAQVVQRAKGGINAADLPKYQAIQEVMAVKPDYVLMEAINIRATPEGVVRSLDPAYAWCAGQVKKGRFKMLVYETPQANSKRFREYFRNPEHKCYGRIMVNQVTDANADACHQAVVDLCTKYGFPRVDIGPRVDRYLAENPGVKLVPHMLNDWYHPNQWGCALFGREIYEGIRKNWPELPVRPVRMPPPPGRQ